MPVSGEDDNPFRAIFEELRSRPSRGQLLFESGRNVEQTPNPFGIQFYGQTTPIFRQSMINAYGNLPQSTREYLAETGIQVRIGGIQDDLGREPGERSTRLTQDPADFRTHQNQSAGLYDTWDGHINITQFEFRGDFDANVALNWTSVCDGHWWMNGRWDNGEHGIVETYDEAERTLRHETGHGVNNATGVHNAPGFREAYEEDLNALGGVEGAREKGWGYYVQGHDQQTGRDETSAEIWAGQHGGGGRPYSEISKAFPKSAAWLERFQSGFDYAYRTGGMQAVHEFVYDVRHPIASHRVNEEALQADNRSVIAQLEKSNRPELLASYNNCMAELAARPGTAALRQMIASNVALGLQFPSYGKMASELITTLSSYLRQSNLPPDLDRNVRTLLTQTNVYPSSALTTASHGASAQEPVQPAAANAPPPTSENEAMPLPNEPSPMGAPAARSRLSAAASEAPKKVLGVVPNAVASVLHAGVNFDDGMTLVNGFRTAHPNVSLSDGAAREYAALYTTAKAEQGLTGGLSQGIGLGNYVEWAEKNHIPPELRNSLNPTGIDLGRDGKTILGPIASANPNASKTKNPFPSLT